MLRASILSLALPLAASALAQDAPAEAPAEASPEAAAEEAPAAPVAYQLDASKGLLAVVVYKDPNTLASGAAHDHAIAASTYDGTVQWSTTDASACKVDIQFKVDDLVVDPGNSRNKVGIDPDDTVGEGGKSSITSNFRGKSQLDASKYPTITYKATQCEGTTGAVKVTGDLTIRGVTKSYTTTMQVTADEGRFTAAGTQAIKATDFGFEPFSAAFGAVKNQNGMKLYIEVEGTAK